MRSLALLAAILITASILTAQAVPLPSNVHDGTFPLSAGTTYHVTTSAQVPFGTTLTVPAGVVFKMAAGTSFTVQGTLLCGSVGAAAVTFTADTDDSVGADTTPGMATSGTPGHWDRLNLNPNSDASVTENTTVRYGGSGGLASLYINGSDCVVTDCTVRDSAADGLFLGTSASLPTISGCAFDDNAGYAVSGLRWDALASFTNNTASGNTLLDELRMISTTINVALNLTAVNTLNGSGVIVSGSSASIQPSASLTLAAGMVCKFEASRGLNGFGPLFVNGTTGQPVVFTSISDDAFGGDTNKDGPSTGSPGQWSNLGFSGLTAGAAIVTGARVRYAGSNGAHAITLNGSSITMNDVIVRDCVNSAVSLANGALPTVDSCQFIDNGQWPIWLLTLRALPGFTNCSASGHGITNEMYFFNGDIPGGQTLDLTSANTMGGSGVVVAGNDVNINGGATLRLAAGMILKLTGSRTVNVDGTLECNGTMASPVFITSDDDDTVGGDSNLDGPSTGAPGRWYLMDFGPNSDASSLTWTEIRFGGGNNSTAVDLDAADVTFDRVTVSDALNDGITLNGSSMPSIHRCHVADCGDDAVIAATWEALPGISLTTAQGNGRNALVVSDTDVNGIVRCFPQNGINGVIVCGVDVAIDAGAELILEAGAIVKWQGSRRMTVANGGRLTCRGSGPQPVVFTALFDDAYGGNTDGGGMSTVGAGSWQRLDLTASAGACALRHTLVRGAGSGGQPALVVANATSTLRAVRVDASINGGFSISDLAADATNLVAWQCFGVGIDLLGGSFDLVHATANLCSGGGIRKAPAHTGVARNGISWDNSGGNWLGFAPGELQSCNGDAAQAGTNGNLNANPFFFWSFNGILTLDAASPLIDQADGATAMALITDFDGNSRIADHDLDGTAGADMGAYESVGYTMDVASLPTLGETVVFTAQGSQPGVALYLAGVLDGTQFFDPYGFVSIGNPATIAQLITLPVGVPLPLPFNLPPAASGLSFGIQALCVTTADPTKGTFTNRFVGTLY